MGEKLTDEQLWAIATGPGEYRQEIEKLLSHIEWQEAELAKGRQLEVVDLARVVVKPGDTLMVRPRVEIGFFAQPELAAWRADLEGFFPGVRVLVLPIMADVAVIEGGADEVMRR